MSSDKNSILYLFDRPTEPVYVPKGEGKVAFDIPANYLPNRLRPVASEVLNRFGDETETRLQVKEISIPDLSYPLQLGRNEPFSLFIPSHRKKAARLIDIFMEMRTYDDLLSLAVYCRDLMNPNMFIYALSVALLHRPDTKNITLPQLTETFPDKYVDGSVLNRAREEANVVPSGTRVPLVIPRDYTATDLDDEHRVAYWREDIGINLHHWHWHLVYPADATIGIVNKDRRGELFYYMHHQIMARYNCERFCNRLGRTKRFVYWREPILEAYFPKLNSTIAGRSWPARSTGAVLKDLNRPAQDLNFDIHDLERWRDRIFECANTGIVINQNGQREQLTEKDGIDKLGNIVEASTLSPNMNLYGDLHNMGHNAIAFVHDPDHRYLEEFGVMGDSATAMRDPVFYRWHAYIDNIFQEYKKTLPPYPLTQLDFPGVEVMEVQITTNGQRNVLNTYWSQSDVDLSRGLDFTPRGAVLVRFTHLNHAAFSYRITVNNGTNVSRRGTVRIFIAPKVDERGLPFSFREQKELMIEMDKVPVTLQPGMNAIDRASSDSSVTIPYETTFRNLDANRPTGGGSLEAFNFCGCGWPQHMLVPKGTKEGYPMDLFVMVSDYNGDAVLQEEPTGCSDAASFCGLRDRKYPDARAMGYPFDRSPLPQVNTLPQFLTGNMKTVAINVKFEDSILPVTRSANLDDTLPLSD